MRELLEASEGVVLEALAGEDDDVVLVDRLAAEAEIEKIGVLRNPVISWEEAYGRKASVRS